jgi:hypothetical protein
MGMALSGHDSQTSGPILEAELPRSLAEICAQSGPN